MSPLSKEEPKEGKPPPFREHTDCPIGCSFWLALTHKVKVQGVSRRLHSPQQSLKSQLTSIPQDPQSSSNLLPKSPTKPLPYLS